MPHGEKDERLSNLFWGVVLIIIGVVLLGERYYWFGLHLDIGLDKVWPVFVIIAGLFIIFKHRTV